MKRRNCFVTLILLLSLMITAVFFSNAETADSGVILVVNSDTQEWTWNFDDETFTVYGTGSMPTFDYNDPRMQSCMDALKRAKKVVIAEGITEIYSYSRKFFYQGSFEELELQEGVEKLGHDSFEGCSQLKRVVLPKSMKIIDGAFTSCTSLEYIEFHSDLQTFSSGLYGKENGIKEVNFADGCTRSYYIGGKIEKIELASSVKTIRSCTYDNYLGSSIVIPSTVETLEGRSIYQCDNLKQLTICGDKKMPEGPPVEECFNLEKIVYEEGTTIAPRLVALCEEESLASVKEVVLPKTIKRISERAFESYTSLESITIPKGVITIGDYAFENCKGITDIEFPKGLTKIGEYAFYGCTGLVAIDLPDSLNEMGDYCFSKCTSLKSADLTSKVESVNGFCDCTALEHVIMPPTAKEIYGSFSGCYALSLVEMTGTIDYCYLGTIRKTKASCKSKPLTVRYGKGCKKTFCVRAFGGDYDAWPVETKIEIGDSVTTIATDTYKDYAGKEVVLPDQITTIEKFAFNENDNIKSLTIGPAVKNAESIVRQCKNLTTVTFKKGMKKVPDFILYNSDKDRYGFWIYDESFPVKKINLPDTTKKIGRCSFGYCVNLTSITLPEGVSSINAEAFMECFKLKTINFPKSLKKIGKEAFYGCCSLKKVVLPNGLTSLGDGAFIYTDSLYSVVIPGSVKTIPEDCFYDSAIKKVKISNGIKYIDKSAFRDCTRLTKITIPDSVTTIGSYAFSYCTKLKKLTLGSNVKKLNYRMLIGCKRLKKITIKSKRLKKSSLGYKCLDGSNVKTVRVKLGSKSANRKYIKKYKKIFAQKKRTIGKSVTIK